MHTTQMQVLIISFLKDVLAYSGIWLHTVEITASKVYNMCTGNVTRNRWASHGGTCL
jgi:hypothetical protein